MRLATLSIFWTVFLVRMLRLFQYVFKMAYTRQMANKRHPWCSDAKGANGHLKAAGQQAALLVGVSRGRTNVRPTIADGLRTNGGGKR